jgi:hypothetical protein
MGHTDTVYIRLNGASHLEIDNQADILDINTTTCKISGN